MSKISSQVPKPSDARQHRRVAVPKGTFVIISPGTDKEWKVQAIDISQGGMAFIYQGSKEDLDTAGVLKIFAGNADLENVNFETVSDEPATGCKDESFPVRRRGVKFKWMGVLKKADLNDFVNNISP
jgi:c-di-GMP-binding flagellar brake protein YcgR